MKKNKKNFVIVEIKKSALSQINAVKITSSTKQLWNIKKRSTSVAPPPNSKADSQTTKKASNSPTTNMKPPYQHTFGKTT